MSELKLSIVIPIYNEGPSLESFLKVIDDSDPGLEKEIIFVDDGSRDDSKDILERFNFKSKVQRLYQSHNQGKGAALHRGIQAASGDLIMIQDADFEYDVADVPKLMIPLIEGTADVVYGSRFKKGGTQVHRTFHYLVNRILTLMSNILSGLYLSDMETCYKIFRSDILKNINLESKRFGFEPEVTAKVARLKFRMEELPIRYFPRSYLEGKKITWKDGIAAAWQIFKYNCLSDTKTFFKAELPERYKIGSRQWL